MRRISLNARTAHDAEASAEVEVILIKITHPQIDEPIRLSTDPTERLGLEPLTYGTRSTWGGDGITRQTHLFVLLAAQLPDDIDDQPQAATLVLEVVDRDMAALLRSTTTRASVDMAVVLASSPDVVEAEFLGLSLVSAEGDAGEIKLALSRDPITSEPWPARRMTRQVMPGLHR